MLDNTGEITDDLRICEIKSLNTPAEILRESSRTNTLARTISRPSSRPASTPWLRPGNSHACVFRKSVHHRGVEGADQPSQS